MRLDRDTRILTSPIYRSAKILIGVLGGFYALTTLYPLPERPKWIDVYFYSTVLVLTCLLALARPILIKRDRGAWTCVALAITSWCAGDIYWSVMFSDADDIPVPSLADVFYIGMYPLAYAGFILLARASVKRLPAAVWLDGVVTSLAASAVFSAWTLTDILQQAKGDAFSETVTNLSYPIGDLVLLVVAFAALAMVRWRADPVWWLLGLGAAFFAVADTAYLFALSKDTYSDGIWIDGLWMLGLTLMTLAGSINRKRQAAEVRGFVALLVPILFSLSALSVLIVGTFVDLHPITIVLASACLVAAGGRTALTFEQTRELHRTRIKAQTDELSGLGNRRVLDAELPAMMETLAPGAQLAFTIVSVDHVADINSVLGYQAGDTVLNTVGSRLLAHLPDGAVAARLGGVEIAILRIMKRDDFALIDRETRALLKRLSAPMPAGQVPVQIELSAGIAFAPMHASESGHLIRSAVDALRTAKENRSEVEVYDPSQHTGSDIDLMLVPDLMRAIGKGEFVMSYQPKVEVGTGRPVAMEVMLSWHHPTRGIFGADAVYPLATRVGLIRQLTRLQLEAALTGCAAWRNMGIDLGVAVDLTSTDVLDVQLPYDLAKMINKAGLPPSIVTLEISEDVLQMDTRRTANALGQFRHFGMRMALDHYGRTAPSLTRLRGMPIDELKLDPVFVNAMLSGPQDAAVVRSTVELARSLNIVTVADGVDTRELYTAATNCGVTGVQGAAFGNPMNAEQLGVWLDSVRARPVPSRS